jgi:hypothetical protein
MVCPTKHHFFLLLLLSNFALVNRGAALYCSILKRKKDDNWPNNLKLMCVPNDSDIYFKHVNLNVKEEQPITFENGEYIYKKTIGIIFKNYKKIKQTEYFLSAVLKSDTSKFKIDLGNIIVRIV